MKVPPDDELKNITLLVFDKVIGDITLELDKDLDGLKYKSYLMQTNELNDGSKYTSWNFTDSMDWDGDLENSLWYSRNSTVLYTTKNLIVGQDQPVEIKLPVKIIKETRLNYLDFLFPSAPVDKTFLLW